MGKKRPKRQPKKLSVDIVEARYIALVDEFGIERMSLFCLGGDGGTGGMAVIQFKDDAGSPRIEIQVTAKESGIRVSNNDGSTGVSLSVNYGKSNGIYVGSHDGKQCIQIGIPDPKSDHPRGPHPDILFFDDNSKEFWSARDGARIVTRVEQPPST